MKDDAKKAGSTGGGQTIICIDDDPSMRKLTERTLVKAGYRVKSGGSARAALELLRERADAALVLMDIHMPGATGFELLKLLKGDEKVKAVPVLMLSATADRERDRAQALTLGAVDLLSYPISDEDLVEAVGKAIGKSAGK